MQQVVIVLKIFESVLRSSIENFKTITNFKVRQRIRVLHYSSSESFLSKVHIRARQATGRLYKLIIVKKNDNTVSWLDLDETLIEIFFLRQRS